MLSACNTLHQRSLQLCHMLMVMVAVDAIRQLCAAVLNAAEHVSYRPTSTRSEVAQQSEAVYKHDNCCTKEFEWNAALKNS